jgi:outer membrane lipoprotein-sorting protein
MQLFAKSGKQLKEIALSDIRQIQGRWYPMKTVYKDVLKDGKGTEFTISEISFNQRIPGNVFNKSNLK